MAAWRYKINSLLVLKKYFTCLLSSLVKYFSTLKEKFRISVQPCNILYLLICQSRIVWEKPHTNLGTQFMIGITYTI